MKKINEELYVGSQISADDIKALKDHGIKKKEGCDDAEYRSQRHSQTPVFNY